MQRRSFLAALAAVGAWLASGVGVGATPSRVPGSEPAARLLAAFKRPGSAAAVGRAYLARRPHEAEAARLVRLIADPLALQGCDVACAPPDALRAALGRAIRDDFARGAVANVDGWILAITEARLCGLAALRLA